MEYWEKAVVLRLNGATRQTFTIKDSKSAAHFLLSRWPHKTGTSYRRAILTCSAVLNGRLSQEAAQSAFVVAAMEAAIPFEVKDRFEAEIAAICGAIFEEDSLEFELATQLLELDDGPTPPFSWPYPEASGQLGR